MCKSKKKIKSKGFTEVHLQRQRENVLSGRMRRPKCLQEAPVLSSPAGNYFKKTKKTTQKQR